MQEKKKCWFYDRVTDGMYAASFVQQMSISKNDKKLLLSLIRSDMDKAVQYNLRKYKKT